MALTRRRFLQLTGTTTLGAVVFVACGVPEKELQIESPVELPEDLVTGLENWYATLCTQCSSACGVIVRVMNGRAKKIEGNPDFPLNQGKHIARCEATLQALYHPDRIQTPLRRVGEQFEPISWDQALDELEGKLRAASGGGFVLASGPLRGHLGLVAERFTEALGGRHLTYEPLEQTVLRQAVKDVFGQDQLPDFDIENTQFLLSFGADFLSTWLSPVRYARAYGEFRQGKEGVTPATRKQGMKRGTLVQVDPRFSMTAANADDWVWIKPGTEGVLALSLAYVIIDEKLGDTAAADTLTGGAGSAALEAFKPEDAARITGVPRERIEELARDFANNGPSLAIGGGSAAAHTNGLFNLKAIYALNYLVGSVGKKAGEGGIVFNPPSLLDDIPVTALASFKDWDDLTKGLKDVKVLMVRGANPVHGLAGVGFRDALEKVDYVVSVSSFLDDTTALADLVLPEHTPLEDWGDAIPEAGPGYQVLALQQPVVRPRHDTRGFGDILLALAGEFGGLVADALPWSTFKDVLRQGVQKLYDDPNRDASLPDWEASSFEVFWNKVLQHGGWWDPKATSQATVPPPPPLPSQEAPQYEGSESDFPFHLVPFESNSLGDGRGAHLPWLQAAPDPVTTVTWTTWVELNAKKADELDLKRGSIVKVESPHGSFEAPVYPHPAMPPDIVSIPVGQGHTSSDSFSQNRGANPLAILAPKTESTTGALAWAATRVRLTRTGRRVDVPRFEGNQPAIQTHEGAIIQVTRPQ